MNIYEQQIQMYTRRIKKIEESPDPIYLKSNKLLYELERDGQQAKLDAWKQGKPFIETQGCFVRLCRSMGFQWENFAITADRATPEYMRYKTIIEKLGFPEKCCDRTVAGLAMREMGEVPRPHVMLSTNHGCDAQRLTRESLARAYNIPVVTLDTALNPENKPNIDSLNYLADQMGEFAEWAEKKVPGVKYDEDRLREVQDINTIGVKLLVEIYQLRKHVPCPVHPLDGFRIAREPARYPNMQKAIEYLRICRDELGERVASGKGPFPEERARLLWAASGPYYINPWKTLVKRKVAMPVLMEGVSISMLALKYDNYGEVSEYGVKLSPLQEEVRFGDTMVWGGPGKRWVQDTLDTARDIGAHGIVHYLQVGCTPVLSMGTVMAERAEKELGIPVLNLEGRQMDEDFLSEEKMEEILSSFIDKCFDWAGKPRQ